LHVAESTSSVKRNFKAHNKQVQQLLIVKIKIGAFILLLMLSSSISVKEVQLSCTTVKSDLTKGEFFLLPKFIQIEIRAEMIKQRSTIAQT